MNNRKENNFSRTTVIKLAQRVCYHCSFPKCSRQTAGPIISKNDGVNIVGRACHIEAASEGGPRYNSQMTSDQRRNIDNGIWCCNSHADIIDNDIDSFSVATLHEWKKIAEANAYNHIDSSLVKVQVPTILVQLSDSIIFEAVWNYINAEKNKYSFIIIKYIYGSLEDVKDFIEKYEAIKLDKKYVVIESSGYGRLLAKVPELDIIEEEICISFTIKQRNEYSDPQSGMDARLVFTDEGTDIDIQNNDGWISGKEASIQTIQLLLGTNRGQWALDTNLGSYLFKYYKDHHKDHRLLERLIKLEISRITSIPESEMISDEGPSIPISTIKWVESVIIKGHSKNLLEIDLKLYFSDNEYYERTISVPAAIDNK